MIPADRASLKAKCDVLLADFDARHPEIVYAIECREAKRQGEIYHDIPQR
jgi:MinD superfamily P-loop ATPase